MIIAVILLRIEALFHPIVLFACLFATPDSLGLDNWGTLTKHYQLLLTPSIATDICLHQAYLSGKMSCLVSQTRLSPLHIHLHYMFFVFINIISRFTHFL